MDHSVTIGTELNDCPEVQNFYYRPFNNVPYFIVLHDGFHFPVSGFRFFAVCSGNKNFSGLFYINRQRACFGNDAVNNFSARADYFADFVGVDGHCQNHRSILGNLFARGVKHGVHNFENFQSRLFRLREPVNQHLVGNAVNFHVHLDGAHTVGSARNFEIHIAVMVLRPLYVGQHFVFAFFAGHQTHRDSGHRFFNRNSGVHQRH